VNKERAFALAFGVLLRACIDQDEPPKKVKTRKGRRIKAPTAQIEMPDLGIEGDVPQFDFLESTPRPRTPPPVPADKQPEWAPAYSPSRENDSEGTDDTVPWMNGPR
jgi:hypothetical protein